MIGIAIRLALALGLHLRNEDPEAEESKKELLVHTWWSLHSTECLVSTITGRPPAVAFEDCTVSLPCSFPGEQQEMGDTSRESAQRRTGYDSQQIMESGRMSEAGHRVSNQYRYLIDQIKIKIISQKALLELYSPRTAAGSWEVRILI